MSNGTTAAVERMSSKELAAALMEHHRRLRTIMCDVDDGLAPELAELDHENTRKLVDSLKAAVEAIEPMFLSVNGMAGYDEVESLR